MRFVVVTSLLSAGLITAVSAVSIAVLSFIYANNSSYDNTVDTKNEIQWGEGS